MPSEHGRAGSYFVQDTDNPPCRRNELFLAFESYHSPRMRRMREDYGLEDLLAGTQGEWQRILALRGWLRSKIEIEDDNPAKTRLEAFAILDAALAGGRFECTHFSIVQHAMLNSFGYVTRRLQCGPGMPEDGGNHGVNEVWVNDLAKWVLVDAKYDLHFEKDGIPLSALEIRDEVWRDGGGSVVPLPGPTDQGRGKASTYRWCAWETDTNRFTSFPNTGTSTLVVLADEWFKSSTWHRDGKPHWAYGTPYFIETTRRGWIEWTPNTIASRARIEGQSASIAIESFTPNFKTYQLKGPDGVWRDCDDRMEIALERDRHEVSFRSVNLFGVCGPPHKVVIEYEE